MGRLKRALADQKSFYRLNPLDQSMPHFIACLENKASRGSGVQSGRQPVPCADLAPQAQGSFFSFW